MGRDLDGRLAELTGLLGLAPIDVESGHERWGVYRASIQVPVSWQLLGDAVQREPDTAIALSVVLAMLEKLPMEQRDEWVERLPSEKEMGYARQRSQELRVLAGLSGDGGIASADVRFDASWSVWLQLRLAEAVTNESLLVQLSQRGATRRVRNAAVSRLRP
jgi:hypothetical protein